MKRAMLTLLAIFTYSMVFAKYHMPILESSMNASAVVTAGIPGQLNITLTITNTGDQDLTNIYLNAPNSISFTTTSVPFLAISQSITIEGTRPFTACVYGGNLFVMATSVDNTPLIPVEVNLQYTDSISPAPQVSSVILPNCTQVPVNGNMEITLSGLPSGNWTLHGDNASSYTYSGAGTTVVLNLDASIVGSGIHFYYDVPSGCSSGLSQLVTRNVIHSSPGGSMTGTYFDTNSDGMVNVGDQILYQITVVNSGACAINAAINGNALTPYNYFLSFTGNPTIDVEVPGYSTLAVPATYNLTQVWINAGYVYNETKVNVYWSDALGGISASYRPDCITFLDNLSTTDLSFQNFISYPNPVANMWQISNALPIEKVEILTMLGQYVRTIMLHDLTISINLSDLSSGNYIAKVYSSHHVKSVKIFKS